MVSLRALCTTTRVLYGLHRGTRRDSGMLVYQMGKVASKSIHATLASALPGTPIIHIHKLNPANFRDFRKTMWRQDPIFLKYMRASYLSSRFDASFFEDRRWKIITLVRDPVARNLSQFFYSIGSYIPFIDDRSQLQREDVHELKSIFLDNFPNHTLPIEWFDGELRAVFGYDILSKPFDHKAGYAIHDHILALRVEDINRVGPSALSRFLGVEINSIEKINTAKDEGYYDLYSFFKNIIKIPSSYLEKRTTTSTAATSTLSPR